MLKSICVLTFMIMFTASSYASTSTPTLSYGQKVILNRYNQYIDLVFQASQLSGMPMEELAAFVKIESTFDKNAYNSTFGAKGLLQHLDSTWRKHITIYGKKAGVKKGDNVYNPKSSLFLGAVALAEERKQMAKDTHRNIEDIQSGDLYLSHMYGYTRAVKILNAPKGTKISKFVKINPSSGLTFYHGKRIMTTEEFRSAANNKLNKEKALFIEPTRRYILAKYINEVKDTVVFKYALTAMRN